MAILDDDWEMNFPQQGIGLSARRIGEHLERGQINPFVAVTLARCTRPELFIDVIDLTRRFKRMVGLTVADLQAGRYGLLRNTAVSEVLADLHVAPADAWLQRVGNALRNSLIRKLVRNRPTPLLPMVASTPLGLRGLDCALDCWLASQSAQKAGASQWQARLANLSSRGLRRDELAQSGLETWLASKGALPISVQALRDALDFSAVRLSLVAVHATALRQLDFVDGKAATSGKRRTPKQTGPGPTMRPLLRDRVLGYAIDRVTWDDMLGRAECFVAFDHRGELLRGFDGRSGYCKNINEARIVAARHAAVHYPKVTLRGNWSQIRQSGGWSYREWLVTLPYYPDSFCSTHFDYRNVLLHVRCDMREDRDGKTVLVLQEVQSDWAQRARRQQQQAGNCDPDVPVPPWLEEWPALALKIMLLHAAASGALALAWTPGAVQVARYRGLGAAGLVNLYDRTLPAAMNKLLKEYGRECETVEIFQPVNFRIATAELGYVVFGEDDDMLGYADSWEDACLLLPDGAEEALQPMQGVQLDPDLRAAIMADGFYAWGTGIRK